MLDPAPPGPDDLPLGDEPADEPGPGVDGGLGDQLGGEPVPVGPVGVPARRGEGWFSPLRVLTVVVVLVAALVAWSLTRGGSPSYRTAVAGTGTVAATLDSVGTITPVDQADLDFNVSGTVSAVDVSVGQTVTAGQTLASLDVAALNATVISAQASLAAAKATLAGAESSETATTSSTSSTTSSRTGTTTATTPASGSGSGSDSGAGSGTGSGTRSASSSTAIAALQATLTSDQSRLDADSTQAGAALQQATDVCATPTTTPASPSTTTTTTTSTTAPSSSGGGSAACSAALSQATSAQARVATDIKQVSADEKILTTALEPASGGSGGTATSTSGSGTVTSSGAGAGAGTGATGATGGTGSSDPSAKKATPQQIGVDQASVDTAAANLSDAQQAVAGADLVSTIAGTVASVGIAAGDSVTAGSTTARIVVIGKGSSYDLSTEVAVSDIGRVAVGQQALVTPDSTDTVVKGQVSAIGVVANAGSTTTTYPVTVTLDSSDLGQLSGVDGGVEIITQRAVNVTTVPTSAIRTVGSFHLVTVMKGGTPSPVRVTLGTVGDILTQVTSGVTRGQVVSLANLDEPLPSTSSTTSRFGGGLGGGAGFGGARFGGAGFTGGGFGGRFGG